MLVWKLEYSRVLARLQWVRGIYFVTVVAIDVVATYTPAPEPVRTIGLRCHYYIVRNIGNALQRTTYSANFKF